MNAWLDDFFVSYFRHRPVNATFIGRHEYDDRLPDFSDAGVAAVLSDMESLSNRLAALPAEPLTTSEWLDRTLAAGFLEIQTWEYNSQHFQRGNPATYTGEAVFSVIGLFLRPFATLTHKVEAAIARMEAIPELLAQGQANVRQAPVLWTERAIRECKGALAFFGAGINLLMQENGITDPRFRAAADTAAAAFAGFQHYLETELLRQPADHYAAVKPRSIC